MSAPESFSDEKGIVTKVSPRSVTETARRLSEILDAKGLVMFASIDQQAEAQKVGLDLRPTILVICGSPRAGTPIMAHSPLSALDLPLKVLIWDDEGTTKVSYVAPTEIGARYNLPANLEHNLTGIDTVTDAVVSP